MPYIFFTVFSFSLFDIFNSLSAPRLLLTGQVLFNRITLLDHLLCYLGKAINVQMKVKGTGGSTPGSVTLGSSVVQGPSFSWFMRGETPKKHAHLVAKLLFDMAEVRKEQSYCKFFGL